jgi:pyridoxine 4-dehydrogenase
VTKVRYGRGPDKSWVPMRLKAIDIVNLRMGSTGGGYDDASVKRSLDVLVNLKKQGIIRHIGLSNVTPQQFAEADR